MCSACGRKTSVTTGTIFHRSRTPLPSRFAATWFIIAQKNGVSALGVQRVLGFGSYETAWAWLHKLRRVMVRPDREDTWAPPARESWTRLLDRLHAPLVAVVRVVGVRQSKRLHRHQ
jgi:hypothetical protein